MAALDVTKGGCPDDADGRVVTCWRPREPSTRSSFASACSAGGSSGMVELLAASSTLELRVQRRSNVLMWPSLYVCVGMVAELELGHLTPIMRLRTSSGGLGYSGDLFGPPQVPNGGHFGVRVSSGHTHHTEGGSYIGRGTLTWDETLFSCCLLCCSIHNMSPPDNTPRKIIGPSVRKRWDENTPSSKGPHRALARPLAPLVVVVAPIRIMGSLT